MHLCTAFSMWTFERHGPCQWALILAAEVPIQDGAAGGAGGRRPVLYRPGYVSRNLGDIVAACWYLKGGFVGYLDERSIRVLDEIRQEAADRFPDHLPGRRHGGEG